MKSRKGHLHASKAQLAFGAKCTFAKATQALLSYSLFAGLGLRIRISAPVAQCSLLRSHIEIHMEAKESSATQNKGLSYRPSNRDHSDDGRGAKRSTCRRILCEADNGAASDDDDDNDGDGTRQGQATLYSDERSGEITWQTQGTHEHLWRAARVDRGTSTLRLVFACQRVL